MDSNDVENQNQEKAPKKRRSGCLVRAAILCLIPFLLAVVLFVAVGWVQANRTLPEPRNFRPSPLVLAALNAGNGTGQPASATAAATGKLPARSDNPATSGAVISGPSGVAVKATAPEIATPSFELIPESELARPELRDQARQINASFRQWVDALRRYEENPVKYRATLQATDQAFYDLYPQYAYFQLELQLAKTSLGAAWQKPLTDACLQLLIHYGNWEAASDLCWQHEQFYSWDETLYALRQIPKPVVKYARIVVWSGGRQVIKVIKAVNRQQ